MAKSRRGGQGPSRTVVPKKKLHYRHSELANLLLSRVQVRRGAK
jgi:hypothetical protein